MCVYVQLFLSYTLYHTLLINPNPNPNPNSLDYLKPINVLVIAFFIVRTLIGLKLIVTTYT